MKKLFSEGFARKLEEKWGFKKDKDQVDFSLTTPLEKYINLPDQTKCYHPFFGLCTLADVRTSFKMGEISFNKCWRVPTEEFMDYSVKKEGKISIRATAQYREFINALTNKY